MFSSNAMSSLPMSDDGKKPRTFFGSVKLFLNGATLTFTLNLNNLLSFVLNKNLVTNFSLPINKIIDFSRRR